LADDVGHPSSDAFPALYSGNTEAAKADDARAQQRGGVEIVETRRQWDREVCANLHILRVAAVHRIFSNYGMIAEIFHAVAAEPATAVYPAHPGDANAALLEGISLSPYGDTLLPSFHQK